MSLINWIDLPNLGDDRGSLIVAESQKSIPFEVKRLYYILGVKADTPRGFHAHKNLNQVAFCIQGSCKMLMDNGKDKEEITLNQPNKGLQIPAMVWHEMHDFSEDCVLLVLASDYYDESDYIRDYELFKKNLNLNLVKYDQKFLDKSWLWLNDEELKYLTMTPDFKKSDQEDFYQGLEDRQDYFIYGIEFDNKPIGACGLKNTVENKAELWVYIGDKNYWGRGLGKIIVSKLETIAISKGLERIYLKVLKENLIAISLYDKTGYKVVDDKNNYLLMEKKL